jgi:hypothetical protein
MSSVIGVLAIGLMVVVLVIAVASLVIVAIIPIARFLENRQDDPTIES